LAEGQDSELRFVASHVPADLSAAEALSFDDYLENEIAFAELAFSRLASVGQTHVFLDQALDPLTQAVLVDMFDAA
jgi:hypothetical protein